MVRFCMKKIIIIALIFITSIFSAFGKELLLFVDNGSQHVFLGCFSCNPYSDNSIWNEYGDYGSKYSDNSIWNKFGDYGSNFSSYSPWSKFSNQAPVLVDEDGGFYGYFTCNISKYNRVSPDLMDFLCKNKQYIEENKREIYDKLFR